MNQTLLKVYGATAWFFILTLIPLFLISFTLILSELNSSFLLAFVGITLITIQPILGLLFCRFSNVSNSPKLISFSLISKWFRANTVVVIIYAFLLVFVPLVLSVFYFDKMKPYILQNQPAGVDDSLIKTIIMAMVIYLFFYLIHTTLSFVIIKIVNKKRQLANILIKHDNDPYR